MSQLAALMRKNYILLKRGWCGCCCQVLTPLIFILFLAIIRRRVDREEIHFQDVTSLTQITLPDNYIDTLPPFILKRNCSGQVVAIAPKNSTLSNQIRKYFNQTGTEKQINYCKGQKPLQLANCSQPLNQSSNNQINCSKPLYRYTNEQRYEVMNFDSNEKINEYVSDQKYGLQKDFKPICFGISIDNETNGNYLYRLRFNASGNVLKSEIPPAEYPPEKHPTKRYQLDSNARWIKSGFLGLQTLIDTLIIRNVISVQNFVIQTSMSSITVEEHVDDKFGDYAKGSFGIWIVQPMMLIFLQLLQSLLYEKEKKLREGMLMMGLSPVTFYLSWILTYLMITFIISLLSAMFLKGAVFKSVNFMILFLFHWFFSISLIGQALFISVFFSKVLFGLISGIIFFLLQYIVILLIDDGSDGKLSSEGTQMAASFSIQTAVQLGFNVLLAFEVDKKTFSFGNMSTTVANYSLGRCFAMFFISWIIYFGLAFYLDQVFPNEWGQRKHPLFCCVKKKKPELQKNENVQLAAFESITLGMKEQIKQKNLLTVKNLAKIYSNGKKAVKDVSLDIYSGQIFVLLGHNGAGKSTTISMLTGLVEISNGSAEAYGKNIVSQMNEVRKFMGVCPQHDTLFDKLTVMEHLEMYAKFKGMDTKLIKPSSESMIKQLDLEEKKNCLSSTLSGGQKRRLSVGIAFIGNSKLIFLDEPTSGMDTSARRYIWALLKNLKQDKIIILTTHFLDEADYLGDRIGIMSSGQLLCCGSSSWLKNKYGEGYTLTIIKQVQSYRNIFYKNPTTASQPIIKLVESTLKEVKLLSNVSAEISYQLPMNQVKQFSTLFLAIEQQKASLSIRDFFVSITTLEEVFLKLAKMHPADNVDRSPQSPTSVTFINNSAQPQTQNMILKHTYAIMRKRCQYLRRDLKSLFCELILPCLIVVVGLFLMNSSDSNEPKETIISTALYENPFETVYVGPSQWFPFNFTQIQPNQNENYSSLLNKADHNFTNQFKDKSIGWYAINQPDLNYSFFVDTKFKHASPTLINYINQLYVRKTQNVSIQIISDPLHLTKSQKETKKNINGMSALFIFALGLSFIPASIISFIVKEKQYNLKHQQLVSGVSLTAYWFANYSLDFLKQLLPAFWSIAMIQAFKVDSLIANGAFGAICAIFILFMISIAPYCYFWSFFFSQEGKAMLTIFFLNIGLGSIFPFLFYILRIIESTRSIAKGLMWVMRFFPSFSFGFGLLNVTSRSLISKNEFNGDEKDFADIDIAGGDILFLGMMGPIYMMLVFLLEYLFTIKHIEMRKQSTLIQPKPIQDPDVLEEVRICETANPMQYPVLVRNLRKQFPNKMAVDRVSYRVSKGEVFGLLGVNGAGKSTSFKMLSGEIKASQGECFIMGCSLLTDLPTARTFLGYCPQFDALLDKLTVQEHLQLYCSIKGIPEKNQMQVIEKTLQQMDLERFKNVETYELSGGNKRKLSVGIAMLGNPPVILLDEPSTGMDPEARRFMWDVISGVATKRKESSIILTTHSMEEAEALSTKLTIMVEGQLQCIGSIPHIKAMYGGGYEIEMKFSIKEELILQQHKLISEGGEIRITENQLAEALNKLYGVHLKNEIKNGGSGQQMWMELMEKQSISSMKLVEWTLQENSGQNAIKTLSEQIGCQFEIVEHFGSFFRIKVESNIPLSQLFQIIEDKKQILLISHYSIKQTTLEQIFNNFATGNPQRNKHYQQNNNQKNQSQPQSNIPIDEYRRQSENVDEEKIQKCKQMDMKKMNNHFHKLNEEEAIDMQKFSYEND